MYIYIFYILNKIYLTHNNFYEISLIFVLYVAYGTFYGVYRRNFAHMVISTAMCTLAVKPGFGQYLASYFLIEHISIYLGLPLELKRSI